MILNPVLKALAAALLATVMLVPAAAQSSKLRDRGHYRYGNYSGQTKQGYPISLTVSNGKVKQIRFTARLECVAVDPSGGRGKVLGDPQAVTYPVTGRIRINGRGGGTHDHGFFADQGTTSRISGAIHGTRVFGGLINYGDPATGCGINTEYTARWRGPGNAGTHNN